MGTMPKPPKLGVYAIKTTGEIVLILGTWLGFCDVYYKGRQRKPTLVTTSSIKHLVYVGEF